MTTRFKTYREFLSGLEIVYCEGDAVKIICNLKPKRYVMEHFAIKPWNSKNTQRYFLVKLYIEKILWAINPSKFIQRTAGFELLGKRVMYMEALAIVLDAVQVTHPDSGEVDEEFTISNHSRTHPFKILKSQIQI